MEEIKTTKKKTTAAKKSPKKKATTKKKMGRPKIQIDKDKFEKLCGLQCTLIEIACFFDCSEDTIENWCKKTYNKTFSDVFDIKRCHGKMSLRRTQWKMAETNPTMAIFLGKQYLGQSDRQEVKVQQNDDDSIKEMESYFERRKQETDS